MEKITKYNQERFLVFADPHVHIFSEFSQIKDDGMTTRLSYCLDAIKQVLEYAVNNKIKTLICLGDLYHVKSRVPAIVHYYTHKLFREYAEKYKLEYIFLVGNHDCISSNLEVNYLQTYKPFAEVIYKPMLFCMPTSNYTINWFFAPYGSITEILREELDNTKINILFIHDDIGGLSVNASGYNMSDNNLSKVNINSFNEGSHNFNKVYAGHIHKHQEVNNIIVSGSLLQHDFGDENNKKGFYSVSIHEGNIISNFIEIEAPEFLTYEIASKSDFTKFEKSIVNSNNYYRLMLKKDIDIPDTILALPNIKIINNFVSIESIERMNIIDLYNYKDIINKYVDLKVTENNNILKKMGELLLDKQNFKELIKEVDVKCK